MAFGDWREQRATHDILDLLVGAARFILDGAEDSADRVFHNMNDRERLAFDLFLVRMDDPLAWCAGTTEWRFKHRARRMAYLERCRRAGTTPEPDSLVPA